MITKPIKAASFSFSYLLDEGEIVPQLGYSMALDQMMELAEGPRQGARGDDQSTYLTSTLIVG